MIHISYFLLKNKTTPQGKVQINFLLLFLVARIHLFYYLRVHVQFCLNITIMSSSHSKCFFQFSNHGVRKYDKNIETMSHINWLISKHTILSQLNEQILMGYFIICIFCYLIVEITLPLNYLCIDCDVL